MIKEEKNIAVHITIQHSAEHLKVELIIVKNDKDNFKEKYILNNNK